MKVMVIGDIEIPQICAIVLCVVLVSSGQFLKTAFVSRHSLLLLSVPIQSRRFPQVWFQHPW